MSKLRDKAKGIDFGEDEVAPSPARPVAESSAPIDRPRTAMGAISASLAMGRGVEAENRDLKAKLQQFQDAVFVEMLDPKKIRPSRWANRHEQAYGGASFEGLKGDIASAGRNVQAIKVRRLSAPDGQGFEFEIVFGHRRHRATLELGLPVAAVIEELDDAQLFVQMERENRERADLSPYEQGAMYKRALDEGLFPSQRRLASAIGVQQGNMSTALQLAALPVEILDAFATPMDLQYRWAAALKEVVDRDPAGVVAAARELATLSPRLPAKEVFARLVGGPGTGTAGGSTVQLAAKGKVVGSLDVDPKGNLTIRVKAIGMTAAKEKRIREFFERLFD